MCGLLACGMHVVAAAAALVVGDVCVQQFCEWLLLLFYWPIFYGRQRRRCYARYHNKQNVLLRFLTGLSLRAESSAGIEAIARIAASAAVATTAAAMAAIIIVFNNSVIILFVWCIVFDLNVQSVSVNNASGHSSALAPCIRRPHKPIRDAIPFFFALVWIFPQNPHLKSFTHTCMHARRQNGFIFSMVNELVFCSYSEKSRYAIGHKFHCRFRQ